MMTSQIFQYLLALSVGLVLGIFYFGILWLTVRQIPHIRRPYILIMGSYLLRIAILLGAFYLILSSGDWRHLIACLIGFVIIRMVIIRRIKTQPELPQQSGGQ